jgi:hypothetical protein
MNNYPILEAAANHIEINGQMYEFPVCVQIDEARYAKLYSRDKYMIINNGNYFPSVEMWSITTNCSVKLVNQFKTHITIIPDTEFQRAFQDVFFKLAQIAEGK